MKAFDQEGRLLTETADLGKVEESQATGNDLGRAILKTLQLILLQLESQSDQHITEDELEEKS